MAEMDWFATQAAAQGTPLTAVQVAQFAAYQALLLDWNTRHNLTAVRDPHGIQLRHFLDALTCATIIDPAAGLYLVDVGSGAGFPGVPLKIFYPDLRLTLVESVAKKCDFLTAVVAALELSDVQIVADRAERLGQLPAYREQFDWVVARGVAHLAVLAELLLPLCRVGGMVLAQKGGQPAAEIAAARAAIALLGGQAPRVTAVSLPAQESQHTLIQIVKVKETPAKFPRRVGIPNKRPL